MSKYDSARYAQMMQSIRSFLSNGDDLFASIMDGTEAPENELHIFDIDVTQESLDNLIYSLEAHLNVLGDLEFNGYRAQAEEYEAKLNSIADEIQKRFADYKKDHQEFEGAEYRKYEYVSNVIDSYKRANAQLDAHPGYDLLNELDDLDVAIANYEQSQTKLDDAIAEFDEYTKSPDFNMDFISHDSFAKFEGRGITGETLIKVGVEKIYEEVSAEFKSVKKEKEEWKVSHETFIKNHNEERDKDLFEANRLHDTQLKQIDEEYNKKVEELTKQQKDLQAQLLTEDVEEARYKYTDTISELSALVSLNKISPSIAAGGFESKNSQEDLQWKDELKGKSSEELAERTAEINRKIESFKVQRSELNDMVSNHKQVIDDLKIKLQEIDKELENVEKGEEYKNLLEEDKAVKEDRAEIEKLMDKVAEKGPDSVSKEALAKFGVTYNGPSSLVQNENETVNMSIKGFNNSFTSIFGLRETAPKTLVKNMAEINALLNDNDTFESEVEEYQKTHDNKLPYYNATGPDDPFDVTDVIDRFVKNLNELEDFKGTLKTKEQACAIRDLFKTKNDIVKFKDSIAEDAPQCMQKYKKAFSDMVKTLDTIQSNSKAVSAINTIGGIVAFGSEADSAKEKIRRSLDSKKQKLVKKSLRLGEKIENFKVDRTKELIEKKEQYEAAIESKTKQIADLEKSSEQLRIDIEYLKGVNKVISSVDKFNEVERGKADPKKQLEEVNAELQNLKTKRSKDITKIDNELKSKQEEITQNNTTAIAIHKESTERFMQQCDIKIAHLKELGDKIYKLEVQKQELIDGAGKCISAGQKVQTKSAENIQKVKLEKADVIEDLNALEDIAFEKLARSPKVGANSKYFNDVMTAINQYKAGRDATDNSALTVEDQARLAENLRGAINTYIAHRDTGALKATRGGQMRLDGMKQILSMLDQKEENIKTFAKETEELIKNATNIRRPEVKSEIEKEILTQAKSKIAESVKGQIRKMPEKKNIDVAKLKEYFSCITKDVASKNKYLITFTKLSDASLVGKNNVEFVDMVAATFVANKLNGTGQEVKDTRIMDSLNNLYRQSPKVNEIAQKLYTGQLKPEEFVKMAEQPENIKIVHDQAAKIQEANKAEKQGQVKKAEEKGMQINN